MSTTWDHLKFRDRVLSAAKDLGLFTMADIERASDKAITHGMLSKWFRGVEQPSSGKLRPLSTTLGIPLPELLILAGRAESAELDGTHLAAAGPAVLHTRQAIRVDRLLGPTSALSDQDRATFEALVDAICDRWEPNSMKRRSG